MVDSFWSSLCGGGISCRAHTVRCCFAKEGDEGPKEAKGSEIPGTAISETPGATAAEAWGGGRGASIPQHPFMAGSASNNGVDGLPWVDPTNSRWKDLQPASSLVVALKVVGQQKVVLRWILPPTRVSSADGRIDSVGSWGYSLRET